MAKVEIKVNGVKQARDMTQTYADNMAREVAKHKQRRDQAEVLLRTARVQVTAYENAIIGADVEIAALKESLEQTEEALRLSRDEPSY